ncbi:transmembrane protein [Mycolicibacterium conceptionense]|uniref:Transmembrane protein n=1 Tax=Mycolicibacterium conceptionense TaxID=451644 RepID=A0A0U1D2D3_9MYCO|nr:transmembrane protein [Mycolicibacterium conceptionense]
MTTVGDADDTAEHLHPPVVEALSFATTRLRFDPFIDIDWDATENALDADDPRWELRVDASPLAATAWYAEQPLQKRVDMADGLPPIPSRSGSSSR